jgi:pimeloyl-ACP methyl ester carboxylesterase
MAQTIVDGVPGAQLSVLNAAHLSVLEQPEAFSAALAGLLSRLG